MLQRRDASPRSGDGPTVVLSGCHSGPNPSPGYGTACSLRMAFPRARLIGKDHSPLASGIHAPVFDDALCFAPWSEIDLDQHFTELDRLAAGGVFVSGLDLEAQWLSERRAAWALVPPQEAFTAARKPALAGATQLGFRTPPRIAAAAPHREVHRFCEACGWDAWLKGSAYSAVRIRSWRDLRDAEKDMEATWGADDLYLERHVDGREGSVAFAAHRGTLLDAVLMEKRQVTAEGKTWAARVTPCPDDLHRRLAEFVDDSGWSGGTELEFVQDDDGTRWLIDWNPRFPAWIHGATLAGHNLPALLVAAATGAELCPAPSLSGEFTRIVVELPVRDGLSLPAPTNGKTQSPLGKHPSGMPLLQRRLRGPEERPVIAVDATLRRTDAGLEPWCDEFLRVWPGNAVTPTRIHLPGELARPLALARSAVRRAEERAGVAVQVAYSVKTNPDARVLRAVREAGCLAEVISAGEAESALAAGFGAGALLWNGPVPPTCGSYRAVFADSAEALERLASQSIVGTLGLRVRAPDTRSRFGVDLEDRGVADRVRAALRRVPWTGLSLHAPGHALGLDRWERAAKKALELGREVARAAGREVRVVDVGGGFSADAFPEFLDRRLEALAEWATREFPGLLEFILEPGRAIVESSEVVVTRVVEVRHGVETDVVVDGSVAEVPTARDVPHPILAVGAAGECALLGRGKGRVLGRLCMEDDVLASDVAFPAWLREGSLLVVGRCGAYDASTSCRFGTGSRIA